MTEGVAEAAELDMGLVGPVFESLDELDSYRDELERSGLHDEVESARAEFERLVSGATAQGHPYGFASIGWPECGRLYALLRKRRPSVLVETGVCNGVSSAVMLLALDRNGEGALHSVDLPEHTDTEYEPGTFWPGKKGAAVPRGRQPGWVIPARLRGRWELTLGRSQDVLGGLLDRVGPIDFFLHDSEHSYECMSFELSAALDHLRPGGVLAADDTRWNTAFGELVEERLLPVRRLGASLDVALT